MKCKNLIFILLALCIALSGCSIETGVYAPEISLDAIPEYSGEPFVVLENNVPDFDEDDLTEDSFEKYSLLDSLGRCGTAVACVGRDIMPTEERESIGQVKPSGWRISKYDFVDGKYLYNRCHLIGYQLTGENANEQNLITGTRYFNVEGMLPFENMVAEYVEETGNHVLYRVTPIFEESNLVANGVVMEAKSIEDGGKGICFNVYVYNVQPGVEIDYATGENKFARETLAQPEIDEAGKYILNTNSKKFHKISCKNAQDIKEKNKENFSGSRSELIRNGYSPCGVCNP